MWKPILAIVGLSIVIASMATAQSSTPRVERLEPIDVPDAPRRIEVIESPANGPNYFEKLCMGIEDINLESVESCANRVRYETYDLTRIVGTYDWDWRTQFEIEKSPVTDFEISFTFGPDNKVKVNSCYDIGYNYTIDKNRLGYSLAISRDFNYVVVDNCGNYDKTQIIGILLESLTDGCGIPCEFVWKDDDIYLVNFGRGARMKLTRRN